MPAHDPPDEKTDRPESAPTVVQSGAKPYIGVRIKDRYRIERELGRGGFGAVYLARDEQLSSRPVVIKVLLEHAGDAEWFTKKFREEREALARIDHPGVVGVLDAGEMPDGKPFLVMQYVDGITLRNAMRNQALPLARIVHIVRQIGQALTAAHDRGVYHRDLKPENVMLQDLGEGEELVKIIDFGIATVRESQAAAGTEVTRVAGSAHYMSPEQLVGKPTGASDIFSLGVIVYEMTTGRRPFEADSLPQLYFLQQEGVKVRPAELRADLPAPAQDCILKALAFDPKQRYARARDFGEEFARAVAVDGAATRPSAISPAVAAPPTSSQPSLEMAHVLFMDLVGYSMLPMEGQTHLLQQLQDVVRGTAEFRRAQAAGELISLPTGDGMALVFFRDPAAPAQCAVEVSRALRSSPNMRLRSGIHTGPVYRLADINANRNVTGGGINLAQRVMDSGDAGHILLSRSVAEVLSQLQQWASSLHDLGEHEVKHGVKIQLFNLYSDDVGNRALPRKLQTPAVVPPQKRPMMPLGWLAVAFVLAVGIAVLAVKFWPQPAAPPGAERSFHYWIIVQRYRDQKPSGQPFVLPGEMLFQSDYRIRLAISSLQSGFLYLLNEGPAPTGARPSYNVMFPGANESAGLAANQTLQIPAEQENWIVFDKQEGTEKLWMVWSAQAVEELEAVKKFGSPEHRGVVTDPVRAEAVRILLEKYRASPPAVEKEEANKRTRVRGRGETLGYLLKLEHH